MLVPASRQERTSAPGAGGLWVRGSCRQLAPTTGGVRTHRKPSYTTAQHSVFLTPLTQCRTVSSICPASSLCTDLAACRCRLLIDAFGPVSCVPKSRDGAFFLQYLFLRYCLVKPPDLPKDESNQAGLQGAAKVQAVRLAWGNYHEATAVSHAPAQNPQIPRLARLGSQSFGGGGFLEGGEERARDRERDREREKERERDRERDRVSDVDASLMINPMLIQKTRYSGPGETHL